MYNSNCQSWNIWSAYALSPVLIHVHTDEQLNIWWQTLIVYRYCVHFSIALEILKTVPDPDVVAVCCGGAGLVAGVAAGLKLSGCKNCKVYAVEPTGGKN